MNTPKQTVYGREKTKQIKKTTRQKSFYIKKRKNNKERITRDIWTLFEREKEKKERKRLEREREREREREETNEKLIMDRIIRDIRTLFE